MLIQYLKTLKGPQTPPPSFLDTKDLYDRAYEHLRLYEELYAKAYAADLACRQVMQRGAR